MRAINGFDGHAVTRAALRLALHVFVRPGELRHAEWLELDFDNGLWSIQARARIASVRGNPLRSCLPSGLSSIREVTGTNKYVFPGFQSIKRHMPENALNGALRRLGCSGGEMTSHDFRAMASRLHNEMGKWYPDAIERQLAHAVRRAYARREHWEERVAMMQAWSDSLDGAARS